MSILSKKHSRTERRLHRTRNKVKHVNRVVKPRVSVARSLRAISIQIIDDAQQRTLLGASTLGMQLDGDKIAQAKQLGIQVAQKALELSISEVVFDRGSFKYHGRVKALADGLREGGLNF